MEKREGTGIRLIAYCLCFVILLHAIFHITLFNTRISISKATNLAGFAVGDSNLETRENELKETPFKARASGLAILAEGIIIASLLLLSFLKIKSKHIEEKIQLVEKTNKSQTDIDLLYELLKKNKKISVTRAAKILGVDRDLIIQWGDILESSGLAIVDYPRFGEIEIRVKDDDGKKEEKTKKA